MRFSWKQVRALDSSLVCGSNQVANLSAPTLRHLGRVAIVFMALALPFLTVGRLAFAQGIITGGITGAVVDQTGAIVPGATVQVVSETTGATFQAKSNGEGEFQIKDVPLGAYTITINASGFGPSSISHVQVVAGNITSIGKQALSWEQPRSRLRWRPALLR